MTKYILSVFLLAFSFVQMLKAQSNIENLVLQGVGTRVISLVGSINAIEKNGNFNNVKRIAGVSSGSIVSLLYALGYTSEEMKKIMFEIDFSTLQDKPRIFRIKKKFGYYKGKKLEDLLKKYVFESKLGLSQDATFSDLNKKSSTELYIFATNLNTYSISEFSFRKTPNVKLWEAVRASISIPMAFPAWKFSQGMEHDHLYIDGGIIYDFPINFFDFPPFNTKEGVNPKTLGVTIQNLSIDQQQLELDYGSSLKSYYNAIYQTVIDGQLSVINLNPKEVDRIITIQINGCTNFSLSNDEKKDLFSRGFEFTNKFLDNSYSTK